MQVVTEKRHEPRAEPVGGALRALEALSGTLAGTGVHSDGVSAKSGGGVWS